MTDGQLYRWFFFQFGGRISRLPYFLGFLLLSIAQAFPLYRFILVEPESPAGAAWSMMFMLIFFPTLFSLFALTAKRLHDFGRNGIEAIVVVLPVVSIAAFVYYCVRPGDEGANAYGQAVNHPEG